MERSVKRLVTAALIVVVLIQVAGGTVEDHRSCSRQATVRGLFRQQLRDQVQLQTALSAWDDRADKRWVSLQGRWVRISRPDLRAWYAQRTRDRADMSQIDCSGLPAGA